MATDHLLYFLHWKIVQFILKLAPSQISRLSTTLRLFQLGSPISVNSPRPSDLAFLPSALPAGRQGGDSKPVHLKTDILKVKKTSLSCSYKIGHFYLAKNRTFLLCLDTGGLEGLTFRVGRSSMKIKISF